MRKVIVVDDEEDGRFVPLPLLFAYGVFMIVILMFATPVIYSFCWFTLMFLGLQVDWQTGFQVFWVVVLLILVLGGIAYRSSVNATKNEMRKWAENHK